MLIEHSYTSLLLTKWWLSWCTCYSKQLVLDFWFSALNCYLMKTHSGGSILILVCVCVCALVWNWMQIHSPRAALINVKRTDMFSSANRLWHLWTRLKLDGNEQHFPSIRICIVRWYLKSGKPYSQKTHTHTQWPGFDSRHYQIFWEVMGLERGPLSLVSTTEELLDRKVAAPV
jgi:hypothetical protein